MKTIDFVGNKKWFFMISFLIILTGIIFGFKNGIYLDNDFKGGTVMTVNMKSNQFDLNEIKEIVKTQTGEINSTVVKAGLNNDQILIKTPKTLSSIESNALFENIKTKYNLTEKELISTESIDPLIGKELATKGLRAVLVSSIFILLYLAFVFRKMGGFVAGITAIIAIIHDIAILISVYLVFHIPFNISFVAATLTILGYSLNDTIIVYDRIRENESLLKKIPIAELVNKSITQTLGRTINTVATVVFAISTLYVFGTIYYIEPLKQFTLPLLIGVISGTYSSICIGSPLYVMWSEFVDKKEKLKRA